MQISLSEDLQRKKSTLQEFIHLAKRVLDYAPAVISGQEVKGNYIIYSSQIASTHKYVRPINQRLFIGSTKELSDTERIFLSLLERIKNRDTTIYSQEDKYIIDRFLYTLIQSIGMGLDLLVDPNASRKHVGNRFEELMRALFMEINIHNKRVVYKLPYETPDGTKHYTCENDLVLSSNTAPVNIKEVDRDDVIVSVKTTSKDRMGKMFIDKLLLEKFANKPLKYVGIFLNDVQRKEKDNISYTLVSGLFMVYNKFLTSMEGVYYLDPPPNALIPPYKEYISPFSQLITEDIWRILSA